LFICLHYAFDFEELKDLLKFIQDITRMFYVSAHNFVMKLHHAFDMFKIQGLLSYISCLGIKIVAFGLSYFSQRCDESCGLIVGETN
jgi:hypothetical protein